MQNERWLLPEGIDEVLPPEADTAEALRRRLLDLFRGWGYQLIIPPFVEYLDSLLTGSGGDLDLQTFKLTDQLSGRMMGVRADITPQAARIEAHKLHHDFPTRLCYLGTVLHTRPDSFGGSRSPLQIGAELFGHSGVESDVEVLCLMLETLRQAGLQDVSVDLGHVGIFRGLARQAGLDAAQEADLFAALQRKAMPEIEALLEKADVKTSMAGMITALAELNGSDVMAEARDRLAEASDEVQAALDYVQAVADSIRNCAPGIPLHFDLAELRGYGFHTGVVFAAFVPGHGEEVARGGRYDAIGESFGRARPATGFSADLKVLMRMSGQQAVAREAVWAPWEGDAELNNKIRELRLQGTVVIRELPGQSGDAAAMGCTQRLESRNGGWELVSL